MSRIGSIEKLLVIAQLKTRRIRNSGGHRGPRSVTSIYAINKLGRPLSRLSGEKEIKKIFFIYCRIVSEAIGNKPGG